MSKALGSSIATPASSRNPLPETAGADREEESGVPQPNLADMSISELAWNAKMAGKGKGKEPDRQVAGPDTNDEPEDGLHSSETNRIRQLEEEIERLKNEVGLFRARSQ